MTKRDIIVIGASAGGVDALLELVKSLPADFDAIVFIVLHISPYSKSQLPTVLGRHTSLEVIHAEDGLKFKKGSIYIAPPDHHLILDKERMIVKKGPKENRFRPSIDALFRSAAYMHGPRVIGIVLSGLLNDGTSGLWSVKHLGGYSIIQDPKEALFPDMPENVLEFVEVDQLLPVSSMAALLVKLVSDSAPPRPSVNAEDLKLMETEVVIAKQDNAFEMGIMNMGELTPFTCPECHGALISLKEGKTIRFRCHTGHAFSASTLVAGVTTSVEEMLWSAMRGLEETTMLLEKIANNFKEIGDTEASKEFLQKADDSRQRAKVLHGFVFAQELISEDLRHNKEK